MKRSRLLGGSVATRALTGTCTAPWKSGMSAKDNGLPSRMWGRKAVPRRRKARRPIPSSAPVSTGEWAGNYTQPHSSGSRPGQPTSARKGRYVTSDRFYVQYIAYNENREIVGLRIVNGKGYLVYELKRQPETASITKVQMEALEQELARTGSLWKRHWNVIP